MIVFFDSGLVLSSLLDPLVLLPPQDGPDSVHEAPLVMGDEAKVGPLVAAVEKDEDLDVGASGKVDHPGITIGHPPGERLEARALCDLEEDRGRVAEVVSSELGDQGLGQQLHDHSARPALAVDLGQAAG